LNVCISKLAAKKSVHLGDCWSLLPSGTKDEKVEREYKATFTIQRPRVACEYQRPQEEDKNNIYSTKETQGIPTVGC
jgi:hypothetical protein